MFELNIYCSLKCTKFVTEYLLLVTILDFILLHRDLIMRNYPIRGIYVLGTLTVFLNIAQV